MKYIISFVGLKRGLHPEPHLRGLPEGEEERRYRLPGPRDAVEGGGARGHRGAIMTQEEIDRCKV